MALTLTFDRDLDTASTPAHGAVYVTVNSTRAVASGSSTLGSCRLVGMGSCHTPAVAGNRRPNPRRRRRIRLLDGEPPTVYRAAAGHQVWAECSHLVVLDSC